LEKSEKEDTNLKTLKARRSVSRGNRGIKGKKTGKG